MNEVPLYEQHHSTSWHAACRRTVSTSEVSLSLSLPPSLSLPLSLLLVPSLSLPHSHSRTHVDATQCWVRRQAQLAKRSESHFPAIRIDFGRCLFALAFCRPSVASRQTSADAPSGKKFTGCALRECRCWGRRQAH